MAIWTGAPANCAAFAAMSTAGQGDQGGSGWLLPVLGLLIVTHLALIAVLVFGRARSPPAAQVPPSAGAGKGTDATPSRADRIVESTRRILPWFGGAAAFGVSSLAVWSGGRALDWPGFWMLLGGNLLFAAAALAGGAVLGFVFAVPRTEAAHRAAFAAAASGGDAEAATRATLVANTNLERISDWLTTLLLGATLVQIGPLAHLIMAFGRNAIQVSAEGKITISDGSVVAMTIVFAFAIGFLGVYLVTRLYLTYAFEQTLGSLRSVQQDPDEAIEKKKPAEAPDTKVPDLTMPDVNSAQEKDPSDGPTMVRAGSAGGPGE